jgi:hypothetical protein
MRTTIPNTHTKIHPVNGTTDRQAKRHHGKRLDKIRDLEYRLEMEEYRGNISN